jgi:energy-coupling factor transporter ATP-binding protein EcfA2
MNKNNDATNIKMDIINTTFRLPITYLDKDNLHEIDAHVMTDLELIQPPTISENEKEKVIEEVKVKVNENTGLENIKPKQKTMYDHVFHPETIYGKRFLEHWARYYTSDVTFLKESQTLIQKQKCKANDLNRSAEEYAEIHEIWTSIQGDKHFKDKFGYIDIAMLEPLNSSSLFLQILSLQNLASPVISLLTPLIILIIPFFILRFQNLPIDLSMYISSLKKIAQYHPIGKIFENFGSVPWDKKVYIFISIAFYFLQIYQNIMSCYRFYKNMFLIHNNIHKFAKYISGSIENIRIINSIIDNENLKSYRAFQMENEKHAQTLSELYNEIRHVMPFKLTITNVSNIGTIMKLYYRFHCDPNVKDAISYTFGFNSYVEHLSGLTHLIKNKKIAPCTFLLPSSSKDKKTYFKSSYYAPLMNDRPVKNNISLNKKATITGPNAAGKTTLIKSTLLNIIFSQQFGYGFYKKAKLVPYEFVHSYLNIPDTSGRDSLFQAESRRCREIITCLLEHKTKRHFCIFDELYSGTNPYEAVASAFGFIKYLNTFDNVDLLLTTHYSKLCKLLEAEHVENMHMKIKRIGEQGQEQGNAEKKVNSIKYTYKLGKGISSIKGGIKVLEDLDYPIEIINDTRNMIHGVDVEV